MQRRSVLLLCLSLALILGGAQASQASQTVWSGLVIANNAAKPEPVSPDLTYLEETLKDWFGYNQYKVIGQSRKVLVTGSEDWLAQSKYFSLHIDSKEGNDKTGYRVNLKLFQESNLLLEWEAKLSKERPIIVKGPQVGDGQLILLLVVQ
jgi:opacity protein-like surface antigen